MREIEIRRAEERDLDAVAAACAEEGWTTLAHRRTDFFEALQSSVVIVAYDGDEFLGYARAISDGVITTFLCELLVVKARRGKGIGRALTGHIMQMFPRTRVDLVSDADGFYTKLGFRAIGTGFRRIIHS